MSSNICILLSSGFCCALHSSQFAKGINISVASCIACISEPYAIEPTHSTPFEPFQHFTCNAIITVVRSHQRQCVHRIGERICAARFAVTSVFVAYHRRLADGKQFVLVQMADHCILLISRPNIFVVVVRQHCLRQFHSPSDGPFIFDTHLLDGCAEGKHFLLAP